MGDGDWPAPSAIGQRCSAFATHMSKDSACSKLTPEQYNVCFKGATEPPFTGALLHNKTPGRYDCVVCSATLFCSDNKFDSKTGWPSFFDAAGDAIERVRDESHGAVRTEVKCKRCGSHLGHVFEDGPKPTGLRYCINSLALTFTAKK